ncbi:uncharacterized protein LOC121680446 [Alosa sapidissima]|uniref:uncharacterized protein LOC121680446 n=1 Tax=Alosa sapidissima TaxID=34773 RepID=UPI001C09A51A|nr:uncharacterized protein LOC121680446 [Alosa sapidissima]
MNPYLAVMYSVVEFIETKEVELVPSLWVRDGQCYWPTSQRGMALHQAIKNESYEEGRRKVKEAEVTSDLQSEAEASGDRPLRRKRKSVRLCPLGGLEEVVSEEDSPPPASKKLAPAPFIPTINPSPQPTYTVLNSPALPPLPTTALPLLPTTALSFSDMVHNWEPDTHVPSLPGHSFRWAPQQTDSGLQGQSSNGDTQLLKEVLTKLEMVLDQQSTILRLLQHREGTALSAPEGLPLQDLAQLLVLEQSLQDQDQREKMINYLAIIGGADVRDCTWRLIGRVISNGLAKGLNWRGVNGKTSLASLHLKEVIIAAVRRNPLSAGSSEATVEAVMKRWLQLAADREGGRKRRLLAKENV